MDLENNRFYRYGMVERNIEITKINQLCDESRRKEVETSKLPLKWDKISNDSFLHHLNFSVIIIWLIF